MMITTAANTTPRYNWNKRGGGGPRPGHNIITDLVWFLQEACLSVVNGDLQAPHRF